MECYRSISRLSANVSFPYLDLKNCFCVNMLSLLLRIQNINSFKCFRDCKSRLEKNIICHRVESHLWYFQQMLTLCRYYKVDVWANIKFISYTYSKDVEIYWCSILLKYLLKISNDKVVFDKKTLKVFVLLWQLFDVWLFAGTDEIHVTSASILIANRPNDLMRNFTLTFHCCLLCYGCTQVIGF